jgi:hypothetical protein
MTILPSRRLPMAVIAGLSVTLCSAALLVTSASGEGSELAVKAPSIASHFLARSFADGSFSFYGVRDSCSGSFSEQTCHFSASLQNDEIEATIAERVENADVLLVARGTVSNPMTPSVHSHFTKRGHVALGAQAQPSSCVNLKLDSSTKRVWGRAWVMTRRLGDLKIEIQADSYFGRCGTTEYGRANFSPVKGQKLTSRQETDMQDGPDVFVHQRHGSWKDVSDSGGGVPCSPPLKQGIGYPPALVKVWHLSCAA